MEPWEHILSVINFDKNKHIQYISSNQIKNAKVSWKGPKNQFEPRLLCKMDSIEDLPVIFQLYGICILSVKNGMYALLKTNIYITLPKYHSVPKKINQDCDSLVLNIGNSENSMIDSLFYNGILDEILGEQIKYGPLLSGRHRCSFKTVVGDTELDIQGSQYETDGCYETENTICIIEAKSKKHNSFNIRQLYYPFREVYKITQAKKRIMCLFVCKDKHKIIRIYSYEWDNPEKMLDIKCTGYFSYIL